jgi:heme exporter protein D
LDVIWLSVAILLLAIGAAIAKSVVKKGDKQMDLSNVLSHETLFNLQQGTRIAFNGQSYTVSAILTLVVDHLHQRRYSLYGSEHENIRWLVVDKKSGSSWLGWQEELPLDYVGRRGETLLFQGKSFALSLQGSGRVIADHGLEGGYSFARYENGGSLYLMWERFGGSSWEMCLGHKVKLGSLQVATM